MKPTIRALFWLNSLQRRHRTKQEQPQSKKGFSLLSVPITESHGAIHHGPGIALKRYFGSGSDLSRKKLGRTPDLDTNPTKIGVNAKKSYSI